MSIILKDKSNAKEFLKHRRLQLASLLYENSKSNCNIDFTFSLLLDASLDSRNIRRTAVWKSLF